MTYEHYTYSYSTSYTFVKFERSQAVVVDGATSEFIAVKSGVP